MHSSHSKIIVFSALCFATLAACGGPMGSPLADWKGGTVFCGYEGSTVTPGERRAVMCSLYQPGQLDFGGSLAAAAQCPVLGLTKISTSSGERVEFGSPGTVNMKGAPICTAPAFYFFPSGAEVLTLTDGRDTVQLRFEGSADTGLVLDRTTVSLSQHQRVTVRRHDGLPFTEASAMSGGAFEAERSEDGLALVLSPRTERAQPGRVSVSFSGSFTAPTASSDFFADVRNQAVALSQDIDVELVP